MYGLNHVDELVASESMSTARLGSHTSGYEHAGNSGKVEVAVVADDGDGGGVGQRWAACIHLLANSIEPQRLPW